MRRLFLLFGLVALVASGLAISASASPAKKTKVTLCHRTTSTKHPYVKITVSTPAQLKAHERHAQDIIPAPAGGCPNVAISPTQGGTLLTATMTGANEVPPADPDGTGTASIRLQAGEGRVCFSLSVANITLPATAAHIHVGAAGTNGPIVVPLTPPDATGHSSGCTNASRTLVGQILANPSGYYANVHTTDYPAGAIRGQL
jgi:CHRD domain